jgi:hypothetical protein
MVWTAYKPGTPIGGKFLRVTGRPGSHNEGQNVYDGKFYRLPAGLLGHAEDRAPFKITFDQADSPNASLWKLIQPPWSNAKMVVIISPARLVGMEVGDSRWG